jgi:hypothetical protein
MIKNCDVECQHEPEMPVVEEDGTEILYWLCRCGQRVQPRKEQA